MRRWSLLALAGFFALAQSAAAAATPSESPEATVRAYNLALSERRLPDALARLAAGAVKFNFGSAHSFSAAPGGSEPLTSDLALSWRTVAPVIYGSSESYRREVLRATTQRDGGLASVWAGLRTTTRGKDGKLTIVEYAENYVLRLDGGKWLIAGVASSRTTR